MQIVPFVLAATLLAASAHAEDERPELRFGILTPVENITWRRLVATWKEAEALGFDSAWVNDHLARSFGDEDAAQFEGWTTLAALAAHTTRLRVGILVTGNTYRNPALVAKMATTVDHISGGRLTLGMGTGWFEREHAAYGFRFGTARERAQRLEEALQVITKLWSEDHPTFAGKHYSLDHAPYAPANVQRPHPPIVIGGQGKRWIVPLVARYADGWNAPAGVSPEGIRERREIIAGECRRVGRLACPTDVSVMVVLVTMNPIPLAGPLVRFAARLYVEKEQAHELLAGSASAISKHIGRYVNAGANEIIVTLVPPFDRKLLRRFAEEVIPAVRAAR